MRASSPQWPSQAIPVFLFLVLYVAVLGVRPLFIPDEVRYAEIAREMLASGDWVTPRLNGLLYFEKPPFGHWMNAVSIWLFGENAFGVRFASAMAAGIGAAMAYRLGRELQSSVVTASMCAVVYLTTLEVQLIGTFSVLDSVFSAAVNAGIVAFAAAVWADNLRRWWLLALAGALFGVAALTKGLLGFAIPFLVLVPWLLLLRQWRLLFKQSWIVVAVAVVVAMPWAYEIHRAQPDFWRYFFWVEHIQRFASEHAQHKAPIYYFVVFLPVVAFPWIFLWPAAFRGLRRVTGEREVRQGGVALLVLWAVMPFLLFSISSGKLVTYILPCFVPLSTLVALGLAGNHDRYALQRRGIVGVAIVLAALLLALLVIRLFVPQVPTYSADEIRQFAVLVCALTGACALCIAASGSVRPRSGLLQLGAAMAVLLAPLPWAIPAATLSLKAPVDFVRTVYNQAPAGTALVSNGSFVRAVSWSTHRTDVFGVDDKGETAYGFDAPDGSGRFLSPVAFAKLLSSGASVLLLCKGGCESQTLDLLPADTRPFTYGAFAAYLVQGAIPGTQN